MKQKIDSEVQFIPEIMAFFGLDNVTDITPISEGIANRNYIVKTAQGEYVVKLLVTQTPENIENDVAVQQQLKRAGIRTPEYLPNHNGVFVFNNNGIHAVVSRKIEGTIPRKTNERLANDFGQKLATFHTSVTSLPHINNKGLMNPAVSAIDSPLFANLLPKGIIHGDFHLGNVLVDTFSQDEIVAVLDFEETGENFYVIDLALTVMAICSSTDENAVDVKLIKAAIRGYESVRQLTDEEKASFSEAVRYSAEAWIKWFKENGYNKYAEKHQRRLDSYVHRWRVQP